MTAVTPHLPGQEALAALASRYLTLDTIPWQPTRFPGIEQKILMEDKERGLLTALMRWAPGSTLPDHEHVEIEQTFVLEGSLRDDEGEAKAGEFVWRPAGSKHSVVSPEGALILAFFIQPNRFFD